MHAHALEILIDQLKQPNARVLDVGSGSGYLTACFSRFLQAQSPTNKGLVVGIEHHPELVKFGIGNLNSDDKRVSLNHKHCESWQ